MKSNHSSGQDWLDQIRTVLYRVFSRDQPIESVPSPVAKPKRGDLFHPMIGLESLESRPALLLSRSDALAQASDWIVDAGFWVAHSQSMKHEFQSLRLDAQKWSVVLIAIDDFGGITGVIEDLLQLRRALPSLPVILLSNEVNGDDFSSVRKHLCDVTLRLPLSLPRLNLGLCEAAVNNADWVEHSRQSQAKSYAGPVHRRFNAFPQYEVV